MSFIAELKRRNVFRVGIAYVVASWLLLQLTEVLTELLEIGPEVGKIVIVLLIIGFVPALIFAWAFEMTPEGIKRDHEVDRSKSITKQTGRKLDFTIIGMLVLIAGYFIWESRFMDRSEDAGAEPAVQTAADNTAGPSASGANTAAPESEGGNVLDARSIAVLPFANRSNLDDDVFFTDGIHDDLLTQLAKIRDLKVISRTSMLKYKDSALTIPEIAQELQVANILEGGVQRAGKRVRINAQLIDVANDRHTWAETFDREMTVENIFDIQSEITRQIVRAVRGELSEDEQLRLARVPTNNLEAYEAYLQALALTNRSDYSQENYIEAEFWLKKAVELDPQFAQAWAMLVEIHGQAIWLGYDNSPERLAAVNAALDNARRLGPDLPETIAAEAEYQYRVEQDFKQAAETFKRAHQALPGDVDILHRLAVAQRRTPNLEGAIASFTLAMDLDPNHSRSPTTMAEMLVFMDDLDRAESLIDQWILRFPDARDLRMARVGVYIGRGEVNMARSLFDNMTPYPGLGYYNIAIEMPFFERDFEQALSTWDRPEVEAITSNRGFKGASYLYKFWALEFMGHSDRALEQARLGIEYLEGLEPTGTNLDAFEFCTLGQIYAQVGTRDAALREADRCVATIPESQDMLYGTIMSQWRTRILALAGERNAALEEIARLLNTPYRFNKWTLYLDPRWDFFRDDERFNDLIRPEGAPEAGT